MPSSTSSSSVASRLPDLPFTRLLISTAICFLLLASGVEYFLYARGVEPSLSDTSSLWAFHRNQLECEDTSNMIAILGSSHAQLGINPEVIQQARPNASIVMLAINGQQGYDVLQDIAENSSFSGIVIMECFATKKTHSDRISEYLGKHRETYNGYGAQYNAEANLRIAVWLQNTIRMSQGSWRIDKLLLKAAKGNWPEKSYLRLLPSRYYPADYRGMPEAWQKTHRKSRVERDQKNKGLRDFDLDQWKPIVLRTRQAVETIEERGGRVILVRMPVTDERWDIKSRETPREVYWDCFTDEGLNTIHFMDYPQLQFDCPDTSHLNYDDAILFTRALMAILDQKGWLRPTVARDMTP